MDNEANPGGVYKIIAGPVGCANVRSVVRNHVFVMVDSGKRNFALFITCRYNEPSLKITCKSVSVLSLFYVLANSQFCVRYIIIHTFSVVYTQT